jgi:hypothetical protein
MQVQGKNIESRITLSVIARYASSKGIALAKIDQFLSDMTTDDLFSIFALGSRGKVTVDALYDEWDDDPEFIGILSTYVSDQLDPKNQAPTKKRK